MRRFTIALGLPFEIELLAVWETEGALWLEKEMHRCYHESRVRGEWFRFTDEQLASLLDRQDYGSYKMVSLDISASFASMPVKKPGRQTYWQRSQQQLGKCRQCGKIKEPEREQLALCLQCSKKARSTAKHHRRKKVKQALNSPQVNEASES